jgi:NTE family protein
MLGHRLRYDEVSYFFGELFDASYQFFGLPIQTDETSEIGSLKTHSSALLYLREGVLRAVFTTGRPAKETHALQALIRFRTHIGKWLPHLNFPGFQLSSVPAQTVLILQGGGALGAFEWGVVRALEENRIYPDIVAGVSIGAFNGAIIASHPGKATKVLKAFWKELAVLTTELPDKRAQQLITSWEIFTLGVPGFFRPRWLNARSVLNELPSEWTYLYDAAPMKSLLQRYVDFDVLKSSPVRLLISAVDVETAALRVFDSYIDELTPEHIIASGSLPLALPWTTIDGRHYWDGGIVSNSPLDQVIDRCGAYGKQIFIVDLFPHRKPLPTSLLEVMARRDEIVYAERYRRDSYQRQLVSDYRKLVDETLSHVDPTIASQLRQRPSYIQLMGEDHDQKIMRIMRSDARGEPAARDYDFSLASITRLQRSGYHAANLMLGDLSGKASDDPD